MKIPLYKQDNKIEKWDDLPPMSQFTHEISEYYRTVRTDSTPFPNPH